jgi:hypothetical protein
MKQTSSITRAMTAAQEAKATAKSADVVVYRLYTENFPNLGKLTARYFMGFTLIPTEGYYNGWKENGTVIEVIGSALDLQSIVHLAGDIRQVNNQHSVLVTWGGVNLLNVTVQAKV